jgi:hypothetical protein
MEYYLCEFEYNYIGMFYQVVVSGNVIDYVDLEGNQLILEGSYGYKIINNEPIIPSWL